MAEVIVDIPVTLKKIQLESSHVRRNSTGQLGFLINGVKVQSRYLCSSPASCHDACKYGSKHVFETKSRSPLSRKLTETPGEGNVSIKTINLIQSKKTSEVSSNLLPDSKNNSPRGQTTIKKEFPASTNKPAVSSRHVPPPGKGTDVFARLNSGLKPKPLHRKEPVMSIPGYLSTRRYSEVIISRGMDALSSPVGSSSSRRTDCIDKSKESKMTKKNNLVQPTISPSPKPSAKRALSTKVGNYREPGKVSLLKNQDGIGRAEPQQPIVETVPEKTLYVIETKTENPTVEPTPIVSETTHSPSLPFPTIEEKSLKVNPNGKHTSRSPKSSERKKMGQTQHRTCSTLLSLSSSSSLATKNGSLRHTQNRTYGTQLPSSSSSLLSSSLSASRSLQTDKSGPISDCSGTKAENKIESEKVECKSGLQKIQRVNAEEKDNSPMKLKFRKPKFIDVQHEKSIPRKLSFKRGKAQGENQTAERNPITDCGGTKTENEMINHVEQKSKLSRRVQKIGFEHKHSSALTLNVRKVKLANVKYENRSPQNLKIGQGKVIGEKQNCKADTKKRSTRRAGASGESSVAKAESAEIVLRPRAVQRKRSVEKLNKMIEETASKLAMTRKSKVSALVGAFESVISLQDTKSSATTITH